MEEHSINSSYRERLIEHLFVGELLKHSWRYNSFSVEVAKPEVDNSGYDLIIESKGIIRHVQLKSAFVGAKTARQTVHLSLGNKPSGCVVWIYFDKDTLELGPFLFFGGRPGFSLPDINDYRVAKHTKGNSDGLKTERPNLRTLNKGEFKKFSTFDELYNALFVLEEPSA